MKKRLNPKTILLGVYALLLILPMVFYGLPLGLGGNSLARSSVSSPRPENLLDESYQNEINALLNDHMIGYRFMVRAKTNVDLMLGKKEVNGVYIAGKQLIEHPILPDNDACAQIAGALNRFSANTAAKLYTMFVPTSAQINSSDLPSYAIKTDETAVINKINSSLSKNIVSLDAVTPLVSAKDSAVYYSTDPRLTSFGAFSIYNFNIKAMGFTPASMQEFNIEYGINDYYGRLYDCTFYAGAPADRVDLYHYNAKDITVQVNTIDETGERVRNTLYDNSFLAGKNSVNTLLGEPAAVKLISTNNSTGKNLVLIGDENMDPFCQFFILHYDTITAVDLQRLDDDSAELARKKIDEADHLLMIYSLESLSHPETELENLSRLIG